MYFPRVLSVISIAAFIFISACSDNSNDPTDDGVTLFHKLGEIDTNNVTITLMSEIELQTGFNQLYIRIQENSTGKKIQEAEIEVNPIMVMEAHSHSCPVEQPPTIAQDDMFPFAAYFQMASQKNMPWYIEVEFNSMYDSYNGSVTFVLSNITESGCVKNVTGSDSVKYVITLVQPMKPKVGMNDLEFTVHKMENMMSFPPVTDLSLAQKPTMPDMGGHSSPNNEDPAHQQNGHYVGRVNYSMTGLWRITLKAKKDDEEILETYFEQTL